MLLFRLISFTYKIPNCFTAFLTLLVHRFNFTCSFFFNQMEMLGMFVHSPSLFWLRNFDNASGIKSLLPYFSIFFRFLFHQSSLTCSFFHLFMECFLCLPTHLSCFDLSPLDTLKKKSHLYFPFPIRFQFSLSPFSIYSFLSLCFTYACPVYF